MSSKRNRGSPPRIRLGLQHSVWSCSIIFLLPSPEQGKVLEEIPFELSELLISSEIFDSLFSPSSLSASLFCSFPSPLFFFLPVLSLSFSSLSSFALLSLSSFSHPVIPLRRSLPLTESSRMHLRCLIPLAELPAIRLLPLARGFVILALSLALALPFLLASPRSP